MPTEAEWIALARSEIPKVLDQELAVVKAELIARLSEKHFPNEPGNLDQHVIGQALDLLVRSGDVVESSASTRGGRRPIKTYSPADTTGRATGISKAAARKRLLYGRYLGWAEGTRRHPKGVIGSAGEDAVRQAVLAAGTLNPETTGAGEVTTILNTKLPGPADSGGHVISREANGDPGEVVTVLIEVKNIREWMYPRHEKLYQVLHKATVLQQNRPERRILPVLVCRAAAKITFHMAKALGFFVIAMRSQYVGTVDEPTTIDEVRNELRFVDLKPVTGPDPVVRHRFAGALPKQAVALSTTWHDTALDPAVGAAITQLSSAAVSGPSRDQHLNELRNAVRNLHGLDALEPLGW